MLVGGLRVLLCTLGVFLALGMITLAMMFRRRAMRFRSVVVVFGGFGSLMFAPSSNQAIGRRFVPTTARSEINLCSYSLMNEAFVRSTRLDPDIARCREPTYRKQKISVFRGRTLPPPLAPVSVRRSQVRTLTCGFGICCREALRPRRGARRQSLGDRNSCLLVPAAFDNYMTASGQQIEQSA